MLKKFGAFCLVVLLIIYVVKHPGETVNGAEYVYGQLAEFVDAL